jgi:hypothetical protein
MRFILPVFSAFLLLALLQPLRTAAPSLDDGPGAGGGYKPHAQALDDGPGAGGGYKP